MLVNTTKTSGKTLEADVCVIGAGPAGIVLTRELTAHGKSVVLLESGGELPDDEVQELNRGSSSGYPYFSLDVPRTRTFGGSLSRSLDFGWRATPFSEIDFEERYWVPGSGWPFNYSELEPFYRKAHEICGLPGPFAYRPEAWHDTENAMPLVADNSLSAIIFQISPKNHFHGYWKGCVSSSLIQLCLRSTVTMISTTSSGADVTEVGVRQADGASFRVKARQYVLATGGIENARLLLVSGSANGTGLGNHHGLVGRNFMEHLLFTTGFVRPKDPHILESLRFYSQRAAGDSIVEAWLSLPQDTLRRHQLQGVAFSLRPVNSGELTAGITAARSLWQLRGRRPARFNTNRQLATMAGDVTGLLGHARSRLLRRHVPPDVFALDVVAEQAPNSESRVTLSSEVDSLGMPRLNLDWKPLPLDFASISRAQAVVTAELSRAGIGEIQSTMAQPYGPILSGVGHHHLGTTRMHSNPRLGVVDANSRVHGMNNLYIAGSSVFPTGGFVPPTMTIVAMALRLGRHLLGNPAEAARELTELPDLPAQP